MTDRAHYTFRSWNSQLPAMHELVVNLHMHTHYSDGNRTHAEIAEAALKANLDAVIVTDHNVWVNGPMDYYHNGERRVLLLVGEEIHDQTRAPQKNHLLVFGADRELAPLAYEPQRLLEGVRNTGAIAFIAHPIDPPAPAFGEPDISWVDWEVQEFTGIELWNAMSEFKSLLKSRLHAIYYAFNPRRIARGPFPETLRKWDELLSRGRPVVAIGGSDAHAFQARLGPLRRTLFPYEFHFQGVNTHVFTPAPLSGEVEEDRRVILEAMRQGHAFVGYDLPAPTQGFRFSAQGKDGTAWMGDTIPIENGITLQIRLPLPVECNLLKDGQVVKSWQKREICTYITTEPGIYRVEATILYLGRRRGWIFSNPIYVRA
jgi:hypothetical protein